MDLEAISAWVIGRLDTKPLFLSDVVARYGATTTRRWVRFELAQCRVGFVPVRGAHGADAVVCARDKPPAWLRGPVPLPHTDRSAPGLVAAR